MRILFVYSLDDVQSTQKPLRFWESIQLGISYISAVLKANGHHTQLVVLGSNQWKSSLKLLSRTMQDFDPGLICMSTIQSQYPFIERVAKALKTDWPRKFVIVGGAYPTLKPEKVIEGPFDALCIGEGEYPTLELCAQLENGENPHGIDNLWIKCSDGTFEKNKTRPFLPDLDILPYPDRDMWIPWVNEQSHDQLSVLLARGCPFECAYCSNHALKKVAPGKYVRMRSVDSVIQEISMLHKKSPHPRMYLEVESIALNKAWLFQFCEQLAKFNDTLNKKITFGCNFRITPDTIDENIFIALRRANIRLINIGLESGNEKIRGEVLRRHYSNESFISVVEMARKHGVKVLVYNMVGLPGETPDTHQDTVRVNRKCQPDKHFTQIFYPYQGTQLYDDCVQKGFIPKDNFIIGIERRQSILNMPDFSRSEIKKAYLLFNYRVYKGYKPFWKIVVMTIAVKLQANPLTNLLFRNLLQYPLLRKMRLKLLGVYDYNV